MRCVTVPTSRPAARRDFLRLPRRVYAGDPHWVPPVLREVKRTLDTRRNPYFRHAGLEAFVTYRGETPLARAALVTDRRRIASEGIAQFGYFEARDDAGAVHHLFETLADRARAAGARVLEGPYSPHHYGDVGLQVDGFERAPAFFQPHNPAGYPALLAAAGLVEVKRLHTRRNPDAAATMRTRYPRRALRTRTNGLVARPFDPRDADGDLARMHEVFEDAFAGNWRFLPVTTDEYRFCAKHLALVTPPELVTIVEADGEPVGVLQCALDVNPALRRLGGRVGPLRWLRFLRERRHVRDLVLVAVGVKRAWQGSRAFLLLFDALCRLARTTRALETTWITPENGVVQHCCERLDLVEDRHYAVWARDLEVRRASA